jgi:hypothetical protein
VDQNKNPSWFGIDCCFNHLPSIRSEAAREKGFKQIAGIKIYAVDTFTLEYKIRI